MKCHKARQNLGRILLACVSVCVCGQQKPEYPNFMSPMADDTIARGCI